MKKSLFSIAFIGLISQINAQNTGINTTNPKATLDITAKTDASAQPEGILIPRLTGDQIRLMPITDLQESTMVYANSASTDLTAVKDKNLTQKGYFYWDGAAWQNIKGTAWDINGNAGTDPALNFIGTTDDKDVVFRRFGQQIGFLGGSNISFGIFSLPQTTTGTYNVAIGYGSLNINNGNNNIAIGANSLKENNADDNIAIGYNALIKNTTGRASVAVGTQALTNNTEGSYNTAFGHQALSTNQTSGGNSAFGMGALHASKNPSNTAMGFNALTLMTAGSSNTAIGSESGAALTSGSNNIFIGAQTWPNISVTGDNQLNIGNWIMGYSGNIAIGPGYAPTGNNKYFPVMPSLSAPTERLEVQGSVKLTAINTAGYTSSVSTDKVVVADANGVLKTKEASVVTSEPWYVANIPSTTTPATLNTQDIFQSGKVGIGTSTPKTQLDVNGIAKSLQFHSFSTFSNTPNHPGVLNLSSFGGTYDAPAFVQKDQTLGAFVNRDAKSHFDAGSVSSLYGGSEIYAYATENFTTTNKGSNLIFKTTANGTNLSSEKMRIEHNGNVGIGTTTPAAKLNVVESNVLSGSSFSGVLVQNSTTGQTANLNADGGLELYRDPNCATCASPGISGYLDFKKNLANDFDLRLAYLNTTGTKGSFSFISTSNNLLTGLLDSGNIGIGTASPNSTLQVAGSVSMPFLVANSGNLSLDNTHYTVRIYGGAGTITLPNPNTCLGRIYILIGSTGISAKTLSVTGGGQIYDDVANASITSISASQRITVQSDGTTWIVTNRN